MRLLRFYVAVVRTAFQGPLGQARGLLFVGGLLAAVIKVAFGYEIIVNAPAEWTLIGSVLAGLGWRLIRAPETLYAGAVERATAAERRCIELQARLTDRHEHQARADALADLHFYGAALRHMALTGQSDFSELVTGYLA